MPGFNERRPLFEKAKGDPSSCELELLHQVLFMGMESGDGMST